MDSGSIFQLASQKASWLADRQAAIARNVANANTPSYQAADVAPFERALQATALTSSLTHQAHFHGSRPQAFHPAGDETEAGQDGSHSGNTVNLEQEMLKANDVRGAFALNAGVQKAFHRLTLASAKG